MLESGGDQSKNYLGLERVICPLVLLAFVFFLSLFFICLIALASWLLHNVHAGSAVAWAVKAISLRPTEVLCKEKQRALSCAHRNGWTTAKIIAATDSLGYGAIAVALHPNGYGSVNGIAIGRRSATEADAVAIKLCLRAGGTNPKVRWAWRG